MKQALIFLFFFFGWPAFSSAQMADTLLPSQTHDSVAAYTFAQKKLIDADIFINKTVKGAYFPETLKNHINKDYLFYLFALLILLLAILRLSFSRYFVTLFKVFFNTSLQQSQLTDQMQQAKLPSLLFNLFFFISGGLYIYFLLLHFHFHSQQNKWLIMSSSIILLALIYAGKFVVLKFTGWVSGNGNSTSTYIFIVFLINKILGIFLIPIMVIIQFSTPAIIRAALTGSFFMIGFLMLLRFYKAFGLLQNKLNVSVPHFIMLVAALEILPLLLIYKTLMILLTKNL